MWPNLPKECDCQETPTNPGIVCESLHNSGEFFYDGVDSSCTELKNHDDLTVVIQKLENFFCGIEATQVFLTYIQNHIHQFPQFITLINTAITCETINNCFTPQSICFTVLDSCGEALCPTNYFITPSITIINNRPSYTVVGLSVFYNSELERWESWTSVLTSYLNSNLYYPAGLWTPVVGVTPYLTESILGECPITTTTTSSSTSTSTTTSTSTSTSTTTSTTTVTPICTAYFLKSYISNASWTAEDCDNQFVGGIVPISGDTIYTGCIFNNTLNLEGMTILNESGCLTTTTTSSSTSTTTSSSTTSTTTTLYPCVNGQLLVINNSGNVITDLYATGSGWDTTFVPVIPYSNISAIQNGTNNTVQIDISVIETGCISMYINTILIQTIPIYYTDTFTFDHINISRTDCVWFILNTTC